MARLIHFEIHADDPARAARLYTELLGWTIVKWEGPMEYWLITTGPDTKPGSNGGLMRRRGPGPASGQPVNAFVCTVDVANLDESLETAARLGSTLAVPKTPIPG